MRARRALLHLGAALFLPHRARHRPDGAAAAMRPNAAAQGTGVQALPTGIFGRAIDERSGPDSGVFGLLPEGIVL